MAEPCLLARGRFYTYKKCFLHCQRLDRCWPKSTAVQQLHRCYFRPTILPLLLAGHPQSLIKKWTQLLFFSSYRNQLCYRPTSKSSVALLSFISCFQWKSTWQTAASYMWKQAPDDRNYENHVNMNTAQWKKRENSPTIILHLYVRANDTLCQLCTVLLCGNDLLLCVIFVLLLMVFY